ncbi:hypothetical protein [Streptomyces sp. NPDC058683]|uniref:hypothetical protein n=1 Tax=Streptomyces sp. NPDC058683 TaxID=3346597 RepID=UPI003653FF14
MAITAVCKRIGLACTALSLGAGLAAAIPSQASAETAAPRVVHQTRLWTQVGGGANGYVDIKHTYTGNYTGKMTGTLHHYYAPRNREVVVIFRVDGRFGGQSKVTKSTVSFNKAYNHRKKVSARICLHRSGVPIGLNSGVSYCSPWWG